MTTAMKFIDTTAMKLVEQAKSGAAPQTLNSELLAPEEVAIRRKFCDWLWLGAIAPSRPAGAPARCAGDPTPCFAKFWIGSSESTRIRAFCGLPVLEQGRGAREATHVADMSMLGYVRASGGLPLARGNWLNYPVQPVGSTRRARKRRAHATTRQNAPAVPAASPP